MPLYEFKCISCGHEFEKRRSMDYKELILCPDCRSVSAKIPSVTGFRRDHTVLEGVKK
jgi:putative FmdB family regulatory protein